MKILISTTTFESGSNGPTKFVKILQEKLESNKDVELHFLSEDISESSPYLHKVSLNTKNFLLRTIGLIYRNLPYYISTKRLNKREQFDVIWHNNAITGLLSVWRIKTPQVGMINDYISAETSIQNFKFSHKWIRHWCFSYCEYLGLRYYDVIISNSKYLKEVLISNYKTNPDKITVLYKAVETFTSKHSREKEINKNNEPLKNQEIIRILFVKSNFLIGGLEDLIDALSLLSNTFELHIVGPLVDNIDSFLIKKTNLPVNVKILKHGKLTNKKVLDLHLQMDVFCTPSISEALGVANIEALFMGTPVVYRNIGGTNEVFNNGENGFIVDNLDIESLAKTIEYCIANDKIRQIKSELGRQYVIENFSDIKMIESFLTISKNTIITTNEG